jgi:hypothetical protein
MLERARTEDWVADPFAAGAVDACRACMRSARPTAGGRPSTGILCRKAGETFGE